ncbi:MAG TPA: AcrB/AcrD/AcrF family protein [Allosphingosinicella sp.]|nr:AcrB/AcrD/AcrF family protein [Allosphingosinicella sp.]
MPVSAEAPFDLLDRHWRWFLLLAWLVIAGFMLWDRWGLIRIFALGDTDDNMRIMQVRALLNGQGWYDLSQHRLVGSNIHWSRLVDLPIAALKIIFTPLVGGRIAEQIAVAVAPLLPMLVAMTAITVVVRRLIAGIAWPLAIALIACAGSANGMWQPLRIDHHGWQLAMLAWAMASLTDPRRARGGVTLGIATALSFAIGLEMLPYMAVSGGLVALMWVRDGSEARRLAAYGASLGGGCALAFLVFTSEANMAPICDALTPIWLSAMLAAGAAAVALAYLTPAKPLARLAIAALAGAGIAGAFALGAPQCLGRLEQSSPELERLWLSRVREAMPIWRHGFDTTVQTVTLPVAGLIGYALMLWQSRRDPGRLIPWAAVAALAALAAALLCWQTRAGPAAQLLSIPGATALAWAAIAWLAGQRSMLVRVFGVVAAFLLISGTASFQLTRWFDTPLSEGRKAINRANNRCPTLYALAPVNRQPAGMVLTFVDLGPRLITVTHHDAITGPYHRNARQIIDVMHVWRGGEANAHATALRYRVDYLLICPNLSESTIYRSEAPDGFYAQLMRGKVPAWLAPVQLPANSPYRMWRVIK